MFALRHPGSEIWTLGPYNELTKLSSVTLTAARCRERVEMAADVLFIDDFGDPMAERSNRLCQSVVFEIIDPSLRLQRGIFAMPNLVASTTDGGAVPRPHACGASTTLHC